MYSFCLVVSHSQKKGKDISGNILRVKLDIIQDLTCNSNTRKISISNYSMAGQLWGVNITILHKLLPIYKNNLPLKNVTQHKTKQESASLCRLKNFALFVFGITQYVFTMGFLFVLLTCLEI